MHAEQIRQLIEAGVAASRVEVEGDGRHFTATVVSAEFAGESMLARHRRVYAALGDSFDTEALHALSLRTYTRDEWDEVAR